MDYLDTWAEEVKRGPKTTDDFFVLPDVVHCGVVTGKAGIGLFHFYLNIARTWGLSSDKSIPLLHTLSRRLTPKLPAAVQIEYGNALLLPRGF